MWQRLSSWVLVIVFLLLTLGTTGYIVWEVRKEKEISKTQEAVMQNNQAAAANKLAGTKLTNFTPVASVPELQKIDTADGTGKVVESSSTLVVNYTGAFAKDGTIFESSLDSGQTATFPLNGVIKGWQEGLLGMKAGGRRRLLIPSALAYGPQGNGTIPGNSDLVFDVELIDVK